MRSTRTALIVLITVTLARLAFLYFQLPDTVPSHFNLSGQADGWSGRGEFVLLFVFLVLMMGSTFLGISWMIRRLPDHTINLPHRDYWLAEQRREATLEDLDSRLLWMGLASVVFVIVLLEMTVRIALAGAERIPPAALLSATGVYLAVISIQSIALVLRFSRKPKD